MPATFPSDTAVSAYPTSNPRFAATLATRSALASKQPALFAAAEPAIRVPVGVDQAVLGHVPRLRRQS